MIFANETVSLTDKPNIQPFRKHVNINLDKNNNKI